MRAFVSYHLSLSREFAMKRASRVRARPDSKTSINAFSVIKILDLRARTDSNFLLLANKRSIAFSARQADRSGGEKNERINAIRLFTKECT